MIDRGIRRSVAPDEWPDRKGRNVPTSAVVACPLVEDHEHDAISESRSAEQRFHESAQPRVAGCDATIVHVMAEIWHDEGKGR
jgi:hypothetical protein